MSLLKVLKISMDYSFCIRLLQTVGHDWEHHLPPTTAVESFFTQFDMEALAFRLHQATPSFLQISLDFVDNGTFVWNISMNA